MYKNILIPISLDHKRDVGASMDVAQKLSEKSGNITALHVIEAIPQHAAVLLPKNYLTTQQSAARSSLMDMIDGFSNVKLDLVIGHAGRTIQEYAEEHKSDCIIIASHQPGLQDIFLGSTAAWVVRHVKCAVHVIR